jgi:hypothetical protein
MSCNLTQGFTAGCKDGIGGIKELYFREFSSITAVTTNASGTVTDIEDDSTAADFYTYEVVKETSNANETPQVDVGNGTVVYEQNVTYVLNKTDQTKRNEVKLLAQARLMCIVKDQADNYWLYGEVNGLDLSSDSQISIGQSFSDRNGYSLTFMGREPEPSRLVLSSAFTAV